MIEQIGSTADEAVVSLEGDVAKLRAQLHAAEAQSEQAHAMAAEAVAVLESTSRERDTVKLQVGLINAANMIPCLRNWSTRSSHVQRVPIATLVQCLKDLLVC